MTQKERLKAWLEEKSIQPLEAWKHLGIYRLAAVIHLLREDGLNIKTEMINVKNQFNEDVKVAQYTLEELTESKEQFIEK